MENDSSSNSSTKDDIINHTFFNKYQCIKKLGEGSFGRIYEAVYKSEHFALKFEDINSNSDLLEGEARIMNYLKGPNIPLVRSFGTSGNYNILIMQLMGKSLEDLINLKKTFPIKTVCLLGYQMINVLEYIHNKHIVHRDLKPDNFVLGLKDLSKNLYLLDFGLARKYRSSTTLKQYPLVNKKKLTGTARYASINALKGYEHSRRDDLESAGYVLLYFLRGSLPWQGIPGKNKDERYNKILQKKMNTTPEELCEGFPNEFEKYIEYTRNMEYEEEPDYDRLRGYFIDVMEKENEIWDYIYIWSTNEEKEMRKKEYLEEKEKNQINNLNTNNNQNLNKVNKINSNNNNNNEIFKRKRTKRANSVTFIATREENKKRRETTVILNNNGDNLDKNYNNNSEIKNKIERNINNNSEMKMNYKFATKENSIQESKNRKNNTSRKNNRSKTHNNNRRRSRFESNKTLNNNINNELRRENDAVCCSEACIIF